MIDKPKKRQVKKEVTQTSVPASVEIEMSQEPDTHPDPIIRWTNRRRLAYMAFSAMCITMGILLFYTDIATIKAIAPIVGTFFLVMGGIIGAYVGFATLDGKIKK